MSNRYPALGQVHRIIERTWSEPTEAASRHRLVVLACRPGTRTLDAPHGDGPECPLCWSGVGHLTRPDSWWRAAWVRFARLELLARSLGLHPDDVRARLEVAGIERRGHPRAEALYVPEVSPSRARRGERGQLVLEVRA